MTQPIHVLAAQLVDPDLARVSFDVAHGANLRDIVSRATKLGNIDENRIRVTIVSDRGASLIAPKMWAHCRPLPGMQVVIRSIPGRDSVRSVLLTVVAVAAVAIAPMFGASFAAGTWGGALATAGLTIVGTLLVNGLIPMQQPNDPGAVRDVYRLQGWRNEVRPGEVIPMGFGKMRYAPPFAATSWTEIVGDNQYVRALFTFGYGPLRITDLRFGNTAIDDFDGVDIEVREGRADDAPVSLYPRQVIEQVEGVALTRPMPRDGAGEVVGGSAGTATPLLRFTADDAAEASVTLSFPSGLFTVDDGNVYRIQSVVVRIRARLNGAGAWGDVASLDIKQDKRESFFRQHTWTLPSRGRWQIEITCMTDENTSTNVSDLVNLAALQSIRPEYPININTPIALVAIRAKASQHANGVLNDFNALIEREALVYDGSDWAAGYDRNPATAYVSALMGPSNPFPAASSAIDWDAIAEWQEWCDLKGLKYNSVQDQADSLEAVLMAICGAGRATPRHDGVKWGVVVDWPSTLVVDHINLRNSDEFTWSRNYFDPPHAFRVSFLDETNNYTPAERLVPWPGYTDDITLIEEIALLGKTDPDEIWVEARRLMYVLIHRPDSFRAMQSGRARAAKRSDLVKGSVDVLQRSQLAARVLDVKGDLVILDEALAVPAGHATRFKVYADDADQAGTSTVRLIAQNDTPSTAIRLTGAGGVHGVNAIIHIGPFATESFSLKVRGIEGAQNNEARVIMVEAAPQIDTLTEAETPPTWDGRIGAAISASTLAPAVPQFTRIATGQLGTGDVDGFEVLLVPGGGSTAIVTSFEIDHRLDGASTWTTIKIAVATGATAIAGYTAEDEVEVRARAIATGTAGNYTSVLAVTIGADDPAIPGALNNAAISVSGGLGRAVLGVAVPPDNAIAKLQFYCTPTGVSLDRSAHAVRGPLAVDPSSTASFTDGDATRINELVEGVFASATGWTTGTGWTVANGEATHTPGDASDLSNDMSFAVGATYRISFSVGDRTAGSITPKLTGGSTVSGAAINADGLAQLTLVAVAGSDAFALAADSAFDGSIDDVVVYRETAICVDAGGWSYYVEPQNSAGVAGAVSGPFNTIIN